MDHITEYGSSDEEAHSAELQLQGDGRVVQHFQSEAVQLQSQMDVSKPSLKDISTMESLDRHTADFITPYSSNTAQRSDIITSTNKDKTEEQLKNQTPNSKYFTLEESDSSDSDNDNVAHGNSGTIGSVGMPGQYELLDKNDLPQSPFWRGKSSNLPVVEQSSPCVPENIETTCFPNKQRELNKQGNVSIWSSKSHKRSLDIETLVCDKKVMKLKEAPKPSTFNDAFSQDKYTDKVYYVHHKIAPYLNSKRDCHIPRQRIKLLQGHTGGVNRIKWCGEQYSHLLLSSSMDRTVKIWNAFSQESSSVRTLHGHSKAVKDAVWHNSGYQVISCGYDRCAKVWDVEKGIELNTFEHPDFVLCIKYHPIDSNQFVTGSANALYCWDVRSGTAPIRKYTYTGGFGLVQDLEFMPDGSQFFTCNDLVSRDSCDRNVMAWDFKKGVVLSNQIYQERYTCTRLKVHPSGSNFVAQTQGNYLALFSTLRPYKLDRSKRFEGHKVEGYPIGCDFTKDGSLLVSGSSSRNIYFYSYITSKLIRSIDIGADVCIDVACHPVLFSTIAVASFGGVINVWQ
ncbi:WD repeat-containing protein 25 [Lingula anatina]|uniref:WD repeat-containing protein 25 n=1 Tax=Lingula anatina TaxID=7574 RepID=A0A1S3HKA3_LINAN|nr:WD repeat-containing protein 25 [Lingula anatina]|eukprot:XP_013386545.1 WD repeat-containing protein 25 [Lingula anatina]